MEILHMKTNNKIQQIHGPDMIQCRVDNANLHTYKQDRTILPCCQCYVAISVSPDIAVEDISPL